MLEVPSSALLEHTEYLPSKSPLFLREVFDTKNILPLLLLGLMVATAGTLIVAHAIPISKVIKTNSAPDNDDVQTGAHDEAQASDHDDGQAGDHDDGDVQAGDTDDGSTAQTGAHETTDTQSGPDDDSTTGDQVDQTGDTGTGTTGMNDVAAAVEKAIVG